MKGAILFFVAVFYVTKITAQSCGIGSATSQFGTLFDDDDDVENRETDFKSFGNRILGGSRMENGAFPWAVYLSLGCSGSIISPNYILTAQHCTIYDTVQVNYGSANKYQQISQTSSTTFVPPDGYNDIALIKLNTPIEFNENVSSICLSRRRRPKIGGKAVVAGFGLVFVKVINPSIPEGGDLSNGDMHLLDPDYLNAVSISIINSTFCNCNCSDPEEIKLDIHPTTEMCAGGVQQGTLSGDSGGPLMILDKNSMQWFQIGVTARGESQATNNATVIVDHAIYTDVSKFCDWIEKTTENEVLCSD